MKDVDSHKNEPVDTQIQSTMLRWTKAIKLHQALELLRAEELELKLRQQENRVLGRLIQLCVNIAVRKKNPAVPVTVERLVLLIYPPEKGEEIQGHLSECYLRVFARHGPVFAKFWAWWQLGGMIISRLAKILEWGVAQLKISK